MPSATARWSPSSSGQLKCIVARAEQRADGQCVLVRPPMDAISSELSSLSTPRSVRPPPPLLDYEPYTYGSEQIHRRRLWSAPSVDEPTLLCEAAESISRPVGRVFYSKILVGQSCCGDAVPTNGPVVDRTERPTSGGLRFRSGGHGPVDGNRARRSVLGDRAPVDPTVRDVKRLGPQPIPSD
jgi:hypothetical protein